MSHSTTKSHIKLIETKKKSEAALKNYNSADLRLWSSDKYERSLGLQDVLTRQPQKINTENLNKEELIKEIDKLLLLIKKKDDEIDKLHKMYKSVSKKLKEVEDVNKDSNQKYQTMLKESEEKLKRLSDIQTQNNDEEIIKTLRAQLENFSNVDSLMKKLQERANEADRMESEINNLKRDLQKCGHGASGDKIKVTQSQIDNFSAMQCSQCQLYKNELNDSKSLLDMQEKRNIESEAEINFLKNRMRMIEVMEAELILYKTKYEECECTLMNLKEILIKAEMNEKQLKESREELEIVRCQLQESEMQNQNSLRLIEQFNNDLKERDIYINSINQRLSRDNYFNDRKAIEIEEINYGHVQAIVKKLSNEIEPIAYNQKPDKCKCGLLASSSMICSEENVIEKISLTSKSMIEDGVNSQKSNDALTMEEFNRLREEFTCEQIKCLQRENDEFIKENKRLKEQLAEMSSIMSQFETERISNCQLQEEMKDMECKHNRELENTNSTYRSSICQKICELQALEKQLNAEVEKGNQLEKKILLLNDELNTLKEFRKSYEEIDECHSKQLKELENFQKQCFKSHEENKCLKSLIKTLEEKIEYYKCAEQRNQCIAQCNQREEIKRRITEFKKHYDSKVLMIKCYEKKINELEAENASLKCFRDKFLLGDHDVCNTKNQDVNCNGDKLLRNLALFGIEALSKDELFELENRIKCILTKRTKPITMNVSIDYSKMIEEFCNKLKNHNDGSYTSKNETQSEITSSMFKKGQCLKKKRSKSSDSGKEFIQK
ncbi:hypothetical protein PVAND_001158 [Polypedilum vanderplanki]|uniref:ACT domain-containing protein n=1 Tax=Polypedilum vanderplanki TaxID=319348 RepID=A0A9J6BM26_POLVA|nr:hypothetical protein PVAND_001158 [Polypedilum vanderplanki]